jgi:hypothetical protein
MGDGARHYVLAIAADRHTTVCRLSATDIMVAIIVSSAAARQPLLPGERW